MLAGERSGGCFKVRRLRDLHRKQAVMIAEGGSSSPGQRGILETVGSCAYQKDVRMMAVVTCQN